MHETHENMDFPENTDSENDTEVIEYDNKDPD